MSKLQAASVSPLLSEVSNVQALATLKDLSTPPARGIYSKGMEAVLRDVAKRRKLLTRATPMKLQTKAMALFHGDAAISAQADLAGLNEYDLPHQGHKLRVLLPTLFITGLTRAFDKEMYYISTVNYYMQYIANQLGEARALNAIMDKLIVDVEGASTMLTAIYFPVVDTIDEENNFMNGIFSAYTFSAMTQEDRRKLLAGTPPAFKQRVRKLWLTFCV